MENLTIFIRSINVKSALRSLSFNGSNAEPTMIRFDSGAMTCKPSFDLKERELDLETPVEPPSLNKEDKVQVKSVTFKDEDNDNQLPKSPGDLVSPLSESARNLHSPPSEPENERNEAATTLQKVYKSFRTRRRLADCAVLAEQRWWKLLDFAELKRSSVSFFQIEKPETTFSRWSRARTRAAKVGKGLSKDEKARKLALQHWLEAIDPRHRYGHNLQFYYVSWLLCDSRQPFFYWLDIGDGREVNLERCPRSKLHQQCIKYLGPTERIAYEVIVDDGKLVYKQSGQVIDTTGEPSDVKWIFVLSTSKTLYVGLKNKGKFQHSSFLAGGATLSAGRLEAENGILKAIWPHSGHYLPTEENFQAFMSFLLQRNVDLTNVKRTSTVKGEFTSTCPSRAEFSEAGRNSDPGDTISRMSQAMNSKLAKLEIPKRMRVIDDSDNEEAHPPAPRCNTTPHEDFISRYYYYPDDDSSDSDDEDEKPDEPTLSTLQKPNLFDEEDQEVEEHIPDEEIVQTIDSHKGMQESKWTTGAGPRIGCMKDYPSELRLRVLEQVCLHPRPRRVTRSATIMPKRSVVVPQHHRRSSALM